MKLSFLTIYLLLLFPVLGQEVRYTLISLAEKQPIAGLRVDLYSVGKKSALLATKITNENGAVVFDSLTKGEYKLVCDDSIWTCLPHYLKLDKKQSVSEGDYMEFSARKKIRDLGDFVLDKDDFQAYCKAFSQEDSIQNTTIEEEDRAVLMKYLATNIKYPQAALEAGIQGKVYLLFLVNAQNEILKVSILKSVEPELDYEAVRLFHDMKRLPFKSHSEKGFAVYALPITFRLT